MEQSIIYTPQAIEFVKIAAETCLLLEQTSQYDKNTFVDKMSKLLPLLYLKSTLLIADDETEIDSYNQKFVTETDYLIVKKQIQELLGEEDVYLDTFHPDMAYSDVPVAAFISENLADIHQELKDMIGNYQLGEVEIMVVALHECLHEFANHWGQKLLNALKAIHAIRYAITNSYQDKKQIQKQNNGNDFFDFLTQE